MSPKRLASLLIKSLNAAVQSTLTDALSVGNVISLLTFSDVWLRSKFDTEPIEQDEEFMDMLRKLCRATNETIREQASRVMCSILWALSIRKERTHDYTALDLPSEEGIGSGSQQQQHRLWSHKLETLADILSYIEWKRLTRIPFGDFQNKAWSDPERHPNRALLLREYIERSNRVSEWAASTVLAQRSDKTKARALESLVLLAQMCLDRGNYSSASAIIAGLQSNPVDRIKNLIPVSKSHIVVFNSIQAIIGPENGYKAYRIALEERQRDKKRFIPLLPELLKTLTFIEDANPDTRDSGTAINGEKISMLQEAYELLHRATVISYRIADSKKDVAHQYAAQVFEYLPRLRTAELVRLSGAMRPYPALVTEANAELSEASSFEPSANHSAREDSSASSEIVDLPLDLSSLRDKTILGSVASARSSTGSVSLSPPSV